MTHVYPHEDLKPHDTQSTACPCGARVDWNEGVVIHRSYDGREKRERQSDALWRMGADILAEISAVQALLELPATTFKATKKALSPRWAFFSKAYADGLFREARGMYGELRCLSSALLAEIGYTEREKFLNDMFSLGYTGWVNEMDGRLSGGERI